ncbi:MAG TPA: MMPL family transporter [Candidatus Binatia bacterium]|nr:MMPL family transporter [Candidatus Binatia bacterium]
MIAISRTGHFLRHLVRQSCRRPLLTVALSLVFAVLGVWYSLHALTFRTATQDMLPRDAPYVLKWNEYKREFGEIEDLVIVIEARSFEAAAVYADRLVRTLKDSPVTFPRAAYRVDPQQFEGRGLLYLSIDALGQIRDTILDYQELLDSFAGDPSLAQLLEAVNAQLGSAFVSSMFDLGLEDDQRQAVDTRFLGIILEQIEARLQRPTPYRSPWGPLFSFDDQASADAGYFLSEDKSLLFVLVETPPGEKGSFTGDRAAIDTIRAAMASLQADYPTVQAGVTGGPALANDEMMAAFRDAKIANYLAFALTLLGIWIAFRQVVKPGLVVIVLTVSLGWSMGLITLTVGHLTLFSVMFISIVVGIGIDYGLYFLFRYEEEIFLGRNLGEALGLTAARSGPGIVMSALTAAGTFYVLLLTDFRGIQELGFISGSSILLACLAMLTTLPALIMLLDRRHADRPREQTPRAHQLERVRVPLLEKISEYPRSILAAAGVATAAAIWAVPHVGFDYNLLNLQAPGTESVAWERRIRASTGRSGAYGLASADTLEELRRKQQAFERLPSVSEVDSVLRVIPDGQAEKIEVIRTFAPLVANVRIGRSRPADFERLTRALLGLKRRFDLAAAEAPRGLPPEIETIRKQIDAVLARLGSTDRGLRQSSLNYLQAQLYRDFVNKFHTLQRNLNPRAIGLTDVPEDLRARYVGKDGRLLLQIHPRVDIWERAGAERFVSELRSVDPTVTGAPVITYEAITLMERAYQQGTIFAFLLVAGLTFLVIRRIRETALALLPLVLGLLWTVGLMHVFGLRFTLANVWGLPLIIGASAEFGLNVVMRYLEGREHGGPLVARSTVMAVALSGITTMVGFGSLMVADHRGIFGLGLLLTISAACGLAASLGVLPVVLRLLPARSAGTHAASEAVSRSPAT